jgi:hypothetical protein
VTLAEVLIATALTVSVLAGVFTAIRPAQAAFATQQETVDLQQRLRIAVETIARDLRMAAAVRPYRTGATGDDARAGIFFRTDIITIHFPPRVPGDARRIYFLTTDPDGSRLMQYDGSASTLPLLDDVVTLRFEYFGDRQPPLPMVGAEPPPAGGPIAVTYGPVPPPLTEDVPGDRWGPGENCTFRVVAGVHAPRLPILGGADLAALDAAALSDGPWCPHGSHPDRFDADLLRVRRVRIHLRLQAPVPFRGPAGPLFTHMGTAADARRYVPDRAIRMDVALRNWRASP